MNFQNLEYVEKSQVYLDTALGRARKVRGTLKKFRNVSRENFSVDVEKQRIKVISDELSTPLKRVLDKFPSIDNLPEFYVELMNTCVDYSRLKKALSSVKWATDKIDELKRDFSRRIISPKNIGQVHEIKKSFVGRSSSIMKRISPHLACIEESRKVMVTFPDIKENMFSVCLVGFPNVGKSTLLSKITTANPGIANYAFTTKTLNTGYFKERFEKIQVIDAPGTLARFEKMNFIEKQAHLAVKYIADVVVFVYDLSGAYAVQDQDTLLGLVSDFGKPIIFYLSKTDIISPEEINAFLKSRPENFITNHDDLKKKIVERKKRS